MTITKHAKDSSQRSILESDSPEPTLLKVLQLDQSKDYRTQVWKNGLGTTMEIGIYPPEKDFKLDSFFWRLSVHSIQRDCHFSLFPGYDCTAIVLPNEANATFKFNHQDREHFTTIKPLFPYTWLGDWETQCRISKGPVTSLQFMINRDLGKAQFHVDKVSNENGKRLILGVFCLVYVVDGHLRITMDDQVHHTRHHLGPGQTLYVERDDEASPTSMIMQVCDENGIVGNDDNDDMDANVVIIQISEAKRASSVSTEPAVQNNNKDVPSARRQRLDRRSSLVIYDDQHIKQSSKTNGIDDQLWERSSLLESLRKDTLLRGTPDPKLIYTPPADALTFSDTDVPPPVVRDRLVIEDYAAHTVSTSWIKMVEQGMSEWIRLPVIVCRGTEDGPVVGLTAAVHGNELNGVPCIHRVVSEIDVHKLKGTVVAIPCVNVVGYLKFQREFADGRDLNRHFPGKEDGFAAQVYCYQLMHKIISQFNYLIDLHTASFGRVNSYYVRADMNDVGSATMAQLQQPQVVLHNSGQDGTLRSAASARGVTAITVEIGNPQLFQDQYVKWSYFGIMRILDHLGMYTKIDSPDQAHLEGPSSTILCSKGFWIYTRTGGVLEVYPSVNTIIRKGDVIARVKNIFGNIVDTYFAPCGGIVIGRSSNPVAMAGDRILHLGVIKKRGEQLPKVAKENY
ncbi:hypothetical protein BC940DRAFT_289279 [Gongronella butleri]|nr:hypothetical protein BC940DRAFT_289279 [Gongronella butleri]